MNIKTHRSICITLACYILSASCSSQSKDPDKDKVRDANSRIEQQVGDFNPAFQTNPKTTHIAVPVNFDNGAFSVAAATYTTRPGKLPYGRDGGGDFSVVLKDANSKEIGKYFMENPTRVRVCDQPLGTGGSATLQKGSFDLLLPNNRSIASVEFMSNGKSVGQLSVPIERMREDKGGGVGNDTTGRGNGGKQ